MELREKYYLLTLTAIFTVARTWFSAAHLQGQVGRRTQCGSQLLPPALSPLGRVLLPARPASSINLVYFGSCLIL